MIKGRFHVLVLHLNKVHKSRGIFRSFKGPRNMVFISHSLIMSQDIGSANIVFFQISDTLFGRVHVVDDQGVEGARGRGGDGHVVLLVDGTEVAQTAINAWNENDQTKINILFTITITLTYYNVTCHTKSQVKKGWNIRYLNRLSTFWL